MIVQISGRDGTNLSYRLFPNNSAETIREIENHN